MDLSTERHLETCECQNDFILFVWKCIGIFRSGRSRSSLTQKNIFLRSVKGMLCP